MLRFGTFLSKTQFGSNTKGSVAYTFAIALLPFSGCLGMAVDYARVMEARSTVQSAVDSTVLMLAAKAPRSTQSQLQALANTYFAELVAGKPGLSTAGLSVIKLDRTVRVTVNGTSGTFFAGMFGWQSWTFGVKAESAYGTRKIEIALVLDNTGSMASSNKIGELKRASHTLLNILEQSAANADQIKVGIVPYTIRVNLGTAFKNENWLTNTPTGSFIAGYNRPATRDQWQGCVADRDSSHNSTIAPASTGNAQSLYPMVNCVDGVAPVHPLSNNWQSLRTRIDAMQANGMTNITLGAQWGFELLSRNAPFSEASADSNVERYMILLTDGQNTQDRWGVWDENRMNRDTRALCDAITERGVADAAKVHKIKLYTVLVIDGNEPLLRACASTPAMYMKVNQASQLEAVFRKIADEIGTVRLTM